MAGGVAVGMGWWRGSLPHAVEARHGGRAARSARRASAGEAARSARRAAAWLCARLLSCAFFHFDSRFHLLMSRVKRVCRCR